MSNYLKTSQIALNGFFMGYGGFIPHVDQRPDVFSCKNSRALTWLYASKVVARPADGFGVGLGFMGFSQSGFDARQRGGYVLAVFQTCSASTTASKSHRRDNQNHTKNLCKPINTRILRSYL